MAASELCLILSNQRVSLSNAKRAQHSRERILTHGSAMQSARLSAVRISDPVWLAMAESAENSRWQTRRRFDGKSSMSIRALSILFCSCPAGKAAQACAATTAHSRACTLALGILT